MSYWLQVLNTHCPLPPAHHLCTHYFHASILLPLTQTSLSPLLFLLKVLTDVSATRNIETMMARFPMEAEDPTHTRYMHSRPHPHSH